MRKLIVCFLLCFLLFFVGCSTPIYQPYSYTVTQGFALGSMSRDNEITIPIKDNTCYDNGLSFHLTFDGIKANVGIHNKSGNSVKVLWDDGAFIDQESVAHRIVHAGIKIVDKEKAQVATVIPDGSMIEDTIYDADCLKWNSSKGDWDYLPIVWDKDFTNEEDAMSYIQNMAPVKLLLPIERNGQITEYLIAFKEHGSSLITHTKLNPLAKTMIAIGIVATVLTVSILWK